MDSPADLQYLGGMIQPISSKQAPVDMAKSAEAVTDILKNAQEQSSRLNEKLLKTGMTEKVQDPLLGSRVDIDA